MNQISLLLVDDDYMSTQILKMILENENFEVDVAVTGSEAIEKVLSKSYDAILLDYILPDMSGVDVAVKIREAGLYPSIILLTGYNIADEDNLAVKPYNLVLLKPVSDGGPHDSQIPAAVPRLTPDIDQIPERRIVYDVVCDACSALTAITNNPRRC